MTEYAFKCANPRCQADVTDPLYRGPFGHYLTVKGFKGARHTFPGPRLCYDCWCSEWALAQKYPTERDYFIAMFYQRLGQKEMAARLGVTVQTVYRRKKQLKRAIRKKISIIRDWVSDFMP